jgi:hypothetical protein
MVIGLGSTVEDPRCPDSHRVGIVLAVSTNPACHLRTLTILWQDTGTVEEMVETEFGALED